MSIATQICDDLVSYLTGTEAVITALSARHSGDYTVERQVYISDELQDLDGLKIIVTPGGVAGGKRMRVATEYIYTVGVIIRSPLVMSELDTSVSVLGEFSDELFMQLHGYKPTTVSGIRGLELRDISMESLYSYRSIESYTIYDALILMNFGYYR